MSAATAFSLATWFAASIGFAHRDLRMGLALLVAGLGVAVAAGVVLEQVGVPLFAVGGLAMLEGLRRDETRRTAITLIMGIGGMTACSFGAVLLAYE